jgi:hypothetical protein
MKRTRFRLTETFIAGLLIVLMSAQLAPAAPAQQPQAQLQHDAIPDAPTPQPANPQSQAQAPQPQNTNPVGTAAAPVAKPTGIAASRPAGAVIAPAKQKRRKAILIRVGIIVGAGVAIGTVAALSRASSSRP